MEDPKNFFFLISVFPEQGIIDIDISQRNPPNCFLKSLGYNTMISLKNIITVPITIDELFQEVEFVFNVCVEFCPIVRELNLKAKFNYMPKGLLNLIQNKKIINLHKFSLSSLGNSFIKIYFQK